MNTHTAPASLVRAPLRNRLRLEFTASVPDVWELIGNVARMSEYSAGLERVEAQVDARGNCTEYTCYFKPTAPGTEGIVSHDRMLWFEPNRGWASHGATSDAFGLSDDTHIVVLEPSAAGTLLTWDAHYQSSELSTMKAHFDEALSDIGQNLLKRFGGRLIHCYVAD